MARQLALARFTHKGVERGATAAVNKPLKGGAGSRRWLQRGVRAWEAPGADHRKVSGAKGTGWRELLYLLSISRFLI